MKSSEIKDRVGYQLYHLLTEIINKSVSQTNEPYLNLHYNRKQTKRLESLSVLFEKEKQFKQIVKKIKLLKEINTSCSNSRDAFVLLKLIGKFIQDGESREESGVLYIRDKFISDNKNNLDEKLIEESLKPYLADFQNIKDDLNEIKFDKIHISSLKDVSVRIFSRGKKLYKRSSHNPDVILLHTWRKYVKQLLHIFEFLSNAGYKKLSGYIKQLDSLAVKLGKLHDYHNLLSYLNEAEKDIDFNIQELKGILIEAITKFYSQSLKMGKKLYDKELNSKKLGTLLSRSNFKKTAPKKEVSTSTPLL